MYRPHLLHVIVSVALALAAAAPSRGQTWNGFGTDWNTAGNWNPTTVPNSATAVVSFTDVAAGAVNISSSVSAQSLTFSDTFSSYVLTSSANQTLTLASSPSITVADGVSGPQTINLDSAASGTLLFSGGSNLSITNNSTVGGSLEIGPNTVIGTSAAAGVVVAGPGITIISGSFAAANPVSGGLRKNGPGAFNFGGSGVNLTGGLTLNGGTTILDYFSNSASKLSGGALTLDGGVLSLNANSGTPVTQIIPGGTLVDAGGTPTKP